MLTRLKLKPLDHELRRSIAIEGIVDNVKGYFAKRADAASMAEKKALIEKIFGGNYSSRGQKRPDFEQWLNATLLNSAYMQKKGTGAAIPLPVAQIGGKPVDDLQLLVAELKKMHSAASDIYAKLKPNTQLCQRLVEEFNKFKEGDEEKADARYQQVEKQLVPDEGLYWLKKGGKSWPAIGYIQKDLGSGSNVWPVQFTKDKKSTWFTGFVNNNESLTVKPPVGSESSRYAALLKEVYDIWINGHVQNKENYISYWDSFEGSYDELKYGDEIFDRIYTSQHNLLSEPMECVIDIAYIIMVSFIYAL